MSVYHTILGLFGVIIIQAENYLYVIEGMTNCDILLPQDSLINLDFDIYEGMTSSAL